MESGYYKKNTTIKHKKLNEVTIKTCDLEIIPNKLYWVSSRFPPKQTPNAFHFCVDDDLIYDSLFADFGPLDISKVHIFCKELDKLVND